MTDVTEWRAAVAELTECDHAPVDDPTTYNDTMAPDGSRL